MIDIADVMRKRLALYRAYEIQAERKQRLGRGNSEKSSEAPLSGLAWSRGAFRRARYLPRH
jgi:hypothetical protein